MAVAMQTQGLVRHRGRGLRTMIVFELHTHPCTEHMRGQQSMLPPSEIPPLVNSFPFLGKILRQREAAAPKAQRCHDLGIDAVRT